MTKTIIGIDSETSGLSHEVDQILTLALVALDPLTQKEVDRLLVSVQWRGDTVPKVEAVATNGINPLRHPGVREPEAAALVHDFFARNGGSESPTLGHNVEFDRGFLRSLLTRNGYDARVLSPRVIDTMQETARKIFRGKFPVESLEVRHAYPKHAPAATSTATSTAGHSPTGPSPTGPTPKEYSKEQPKEHTDGEPSVGVSLKQTSVAAALGVPTDPTKAHTAEGDIDQCIEIWRRLGSPLSRPDLDFNNPYKTEEKLSGQVVRTKQWNHLEGRIGSETYYVVGAGLGESQDLFGTTKHHSTIIIKYGPSERAKVAKLASQLRGGPAEGATNTAEVNEQLNDLVLERGFSYASSFSPEAFETKTFTPTPDEAADLLALSSHALRLVEKKRAQRALERGKDILMAAGVKDFDLSAPGAVIGILSPLDHQNVPKLAREYASLTGEARKAAVMGLARLDDGNHRGTVWAHSLLSAVERYGYRAGLSGYEEARRRHLEQLMPKDATVTTMVIKGPVQAPSSVAALELSCDGRDVRLVASGQAGEEIKRETIRVTKAGGRGKPRTICPNGEDLLAAASRMVGQLTDPAAAEVLGFSTFLDTTSYGAMKATYADAVTKLEADAAKAAGSPNGRGGWAGQDGTHNLAVLRQTLSDLGVSYEEFLETAGTRRNDEENVAPIPAPITPVPTPLPAQLPISKLVLVPNNAQPGPAEEAVNTSDEPASHRMGELLATSQEVRQARLVEILAGYGEVETTSLPEGATSEDIITANLRSGRTRRLRELDQRLRQLGKEVGEEESELLERALGEQVGLSEALDQDEIGDQKGGERQKRKKNTEPVTDPALVARCKICQKVIRGKSAVVGMGPACAEKLDAWLKNPDTVESDVIRDKFQRLSDIERHGGGSYPIMIVRERKTGRNFAADVIAKLKDGRYLVVDLSALNDHQEAAGQGDLRDTLLVTLDQENHEVARVFGTDE